MKVSLRNLVKLVIFTFVINIFMTTTPVMAYDADARYREGSWVAFGLQHAGLRKAGVGIYEIRGYNTTIQLSDWNTFINGQTYVGAFVNPSITETDQTNILETAAAMDADPEITYTAYDILDYDEYPGIYINVDEITDIRCDGVVEYAYEWRNVWVWGRSDTGTSSGTPTHFDVSYPDYVWEHNNIGADEPWIETSPKVQHGGSGTQWTQLTQYW